MKPMVTSMVFLLFLFPLASAVSITEVELNPEGTDAGHEWAELYSSSDYNLENHYLLNNDGKSFNLSGTFSGYKVIEFSRQFLDNSDESLKLKEWNNNNTLASTEILKDDKNNDLTWGSCDNGWKFADSSKGGENPCDVANEEEETPQDNSLEEDTAPEGTEESDSQLEDSITDNSLSSAQPQPVFLSEIQPEQNNKIVLTSKATAEKSPSASEKSQSPPQSFITKEGIYQLWLPIAFSFLCLVIIILIVIKKL